MRSKINTKFILENIISGMKMYLSKKLLYLTTGVFLFSIILLAQVPGPPEYDNVGVLASVNGRPITVVDVLEVCGWQEARLPFMYSGKTLQEEIAKLREKALEDVISRKLVYQDFNTLGIKLPREYVENNLDRLMSAFNVSNREELQEYLDSNGSSLSEFKEKAYENSAVDALIYEMCYRNVYITPKQVYDYYEENKKEFTTPSEMNLQVIKINENGIHKEQLETVIQHLKSILIGKGAKEFKDATLLYSEGPNIEDSGDIGWIERDKLRDDFSNAIKDAKSGDVVGPINTGKDVYFIRIAGENEKKVKSFEDAKEEIREKLTEEKQALNYKEYIDRLKSKAYVKYYI